MRKKLVLLYTLIFSICCQLPAQISPKILLKWIEIPVEKAIGVSWGVPFEKGVVKKDQTFSISNSLGQKLPLQKWNTAFWPDGSIKWCGFATVADNDGDLTLQFNTGKVSMSQPGIEIMENTESITINTGDLKCLIHKKGNFFIDSLVIGEKLIGCKGRLECILQNVADDNNYYDSPKKEQYISKINTVTLEQNGPVRTVVRVQGIMQSIKSKRQWLPFNMRMYFYAGSKNVRLVNTIIYDGDQGKDFIKGFGIVFSVPMREQLLNRHVRLGGQDNGIWSEPVKPLFDKGNFDSTQLSGSTILNDNVQARLQSTVRTPIWNDFKLVQSNADGFNIQKRTNTKSCWIDVNGGRRANGYAFIGDTKGGLGIGMKDFWQSYPAALEISDAEKDEADLKIWLWSPYNESMDMRHYDTTANDPVATYEDVQTGLSTPYGIGKTSEITIFPSSGIPSNDELSRQASIARQPPVLSATPEYLHSAKVFGYWSLPDHSTDGKRWIEGQLDSAISFYKTEIDQRNWYGFWNFGDVMHTYDGVRHEWRYDVGGFAWDNTELSTDMWLWYTFLRTGRSDVYRMAEAMTRHTSEVDLYHMGKLAGLGSRHNVRHWGDGSKEVRESQAAYRRFYYYLTTDERTGDIMHEVAQTADISMSNLDPLRLKLSKTKYPTHARIGPDWLALVGNWMTEWERTGDESWKDKIMAGVNSFKMMASGFFSGQQGAFGYDPNTKKMYQLNDTIGSIHLSVLMGGPEIVYELKDLLKDKDFDNMWLKFSKFYGSSKEEQLKEFHKTGDLGGLGRPWYARMPAYAAKITNEKFYSDRAWQTFLAPMTNTHFTSRFINNANVFKTLKEIKDINTNNAAQWCLNAIELLEMIGDKLPDQHPFWSK